MAHIVFVALCPKNMNNVDQLENRVTKTRGMGQDGHRLPDTIECTGVRNFIACGEVKPEFLVPASR